MGQLSDLFAPDRVAVVGASEEAGSVGRALVENLADGFDGSVFPVNPNRESVLGLVCYPSLAALPDDDPPADLVVVAVPPSVVLETLETAGDLGVRDAVVITAGFGETGPEGGRRERELAEIADRYGMNVVGPNSLGVMATPVGMNATFGPEAPLPGAISFMSQSGAFVTAVLDWARDQGIGFRDVVSLGNKAVLDETDFVAAWGDDDGTDAVIGYVESIEDGARFVDVARETTRDTPIVLVKSGRTEAGAQAASSHTGAIAGSERAYEAGLRDAGVLRAESVQELFDYARALSGLPLPAADGVAVVTNAGGPGVMATDAVGDSTLSLADFGEATTAALTERLPSAANVHNPVDVIGDADVDRFADALDLALADDGVGGAVVISAPTAVLSFDDLAEAVVDVADDHEKPVVTALMGGERAADPADRLAEAGIPNYAPTRSENTGSRTTSTPRAPSTASTRYAATARSASARRRTPASSTSTASVPVPSSGGRSTGTRPAWASRRWTCSTPTGSPRPRARSSTGPRTPVASRTGSAATS